AERRQHLRGVDEELRLRHTVRMQLPQTRRAQHGRPDQVEALRGIVQGGFDALAEEALDGQRQHGLSLEERRLKMMNTHRVTTSVSCLPPTSLSVVPATRHS